ncbi:helix-turn-helix domain-containing protein [Desulfonema magnum]|uniref:DNA-binding HTH domain-containing protein n=1 Tax=Desulfonema magnum TaxID=45655 RepID=A0A975BVK7_9BACT|nr:AraC family transcriptional regulator [Desulfonema magnum]QTA92571.1 DNA-binding HTH domain-containing protein [Desulfonema magnum]
MKKYIDVYKKDDSFALSEAGKVVVNFSDLQKGWFFKNICVIPGLEMIITKQPKHQGLRVDCEIARSPVNFCYNLSHPVRSIIRHGTRSRKELVRTPGSGVLAYLPETFGMTEVPPGEQIVSVCLHFSVHTFRKLFNKVPQCLKKLGLTHSGSAGERFYQQSLFDRNTFLVLRQILDCPYHGEIRRLFFEAKSLELVAIKLSELEQDSCQNVSELSRQDSERVREAYHILLNSIEHPPSLNDLSRNVGINRNKLNRGFRMLYGATVFNVLRNARLAKAWTLLQQTELTLAEIAFSVGYNNQSNFTTAFRRQFGITPKTARQEGSGCPLPQNVMFC